MRPDEHKKRKNAQYKKKHGITEKTESSDKKEKIKGVHKNAPKCEGATRKPEINNVMKQTLKIQSSLLNLRGP